MKLCYMDVVRKLSVVYKPYNSESLCCALQVLCPVVDSIQNYSVVTWSPEDPFVHSVSTFTEQIDLKFMQQLLNFFVNYELL